MKLISMQVQDGGGGNLLIICRKFHQESVNGLAKIEGGRRKRKEEAGRKEKGREGN